MPASDGIWDNIPKEQRRIIWNETERDTWAKIHGRQEQDSREIENGFNLLSSQAQKDLDELQVQRLQLCDYRSRLVRELAKIEAELMYITHECGAKEGALAHIEQSRGVSCKARFDSMHKTYVDMRCFFEAQSGENSDDPNSHRPEYEEFVGLVDLQRQHRTFQPMTDPMNGSDSPGTVSHGSNKNETLPGTKEMADSPESQMTSRFAPTEEKRNAPSNTHEQTISVSASDTSPVPLSENSHVCSPMDEISRDSTVLKDNGVVYTHPECMIGVPLVKIDEKHIYWNPSWHDLRIRIRCRLNELQQKHEAALQTNSRPSNGRSPGYHLRFRLDRLEKVLRFLANGPISPYQLLNKAYMKPVENTIASRDILFRLSETITELSEFHLDIPPVEWIRQRLHELIQDQGADFSLQQILSNFYSDSKLAALRHKHGFRRKGRLSQRQNQGQG
ncbi:hypothetical protein FSARC_13748 [Fusarium sarcochroum]|uniref:Uncharacterized protein n=1 Tax=Fusarium sarcochroum TaxID=1208366 RepID=A0A8H4SZ59_9HYPO|nr:hypothetical protein FSARC_13748 [Fusarium sarcochroum]